MKIKRNPQMTGATGKFGDVVYRSVDGEVVVARRPKTRTTITAHQEKVMNKFRKGSFYAQAVMKNEILSAEYATRVNAKKRSAYAVALTDYLTAPKIDLIDASLYTGAVAEKIGIEAQDDFKVVSVFVELRDAADNILESGAAVQDEMNPFLWLYTTTTAIQDLPGKKVVARAKDKPGNVTIKDLIL